MSDVDAKEVTILSVGTAGKNLDLVAAKDDSGWRFQVRTDEGTLLDLLSDEGADHRLGELCQSRGDGSAGQRLSFLRMAFGSR